jgi:gamma-glutamylcyclotransferase (GGCT)/AIG2-like uncharacterized protein YtfP
MQQEPINAVFVYGTLQRGEVRERCWPRRPMAIEAATIPGALYDLGPYPALVEGDKTVAGELWRFFSGDMETTLRALDEVECFGQGGVDLYVRRTVQACRESGDAVAAHTYYFADAAFARRHAPVTPNASGIIRWRRYGVD